MEMTNKIYLLDITTQVTYTRIDTDVGLWKIENTRTPLRILFCRLNIMSIFLCTMFYFYKATMADFLHFK